MASGGSRSQTDRWEKGFAALSKFRAHEGHCCPSRYHVEAKFNLGPWAEYCPNVAVLKMLNALPWVSRSEWSAQVLSNGSDCRMSALCQKRTSKSGT
jgi:hypothetical protein